MNTAKEIQKQLEVQQGNLAMLQDFKPNSPLVLQTIKTIISLCATLETMNSNGSVK